MQYHIFWDLHIRQGYWEMNITSTANGGFQEEMFKHGINSWYFCFFFLNLTKRGSLARGRTTEYGPAGLTGSVPGLV